ncbi:hypothetical protein Tsubulata_009303 [Turnera subulata]|uniref:Glycosyltransferase n=1 Tax=Turnera subulata TaxID=218843 RepID=A0A9Q0J7Z5_9ROSI|nr:hypothetical protein Tsubulata_009303 [Turnera subulata]
MDSQLHQQQLHFILFPFMAQGHMIPMVDMGRMLAQHGVMVTIITTPFNARRFQATVARGADSGLRIKLVEVTFPSDKAGLLNKYENLDMMPSLGLGKEFYEATFSLQESVEALLEQLTPKPSCIISDMLLPYTANIATKFRIPRISFNGFSAFCMLLCLCKLRIQDVLDRITSDFEPFAVPGMPHHVEMSKNQFPDAMADLGGFGAKVWAAETVNFGFLINSFDELEMAYVQELRNLLGCKVWCVGPASLCNKDNSDKLLRGNNASIDVHQCLEWLNTQQPGSVIYACLGSICNLTCVQLIELGLGLEASGKPFIWVVRSGETTKDLEKWIVEYGFEEKTKERGLVIRGWAPQLFILSHPAVGGFLTHCGWNSILEGICARKPMVTWPLFGDQFSNEKLAVQVLKIGVRVGSEVTVRWGEEERIGVLVKKEHVKKAIDQLMDGGTESEERKKRVQELSEMAKKAISVNGSSFLNMESLIQDVLQQQSLLTSTQ